MLYITGDTHGDYDRFEDKAVRRLKQGDVLVVCGDFGFVWDGGKREQKILKKLGKKKYTILFVPGSGDNYDLLREYPEETLYGAPARRIEQGVYQLLTGQFYDIDGKRLLAFGGGESMDQDIIGRELFCDQLPTKAELDVFCQQHAGEKTDLVVSYEPPYAIASFLDLEAKADSYYGLYLDTISRQIEFKQWFFGKHHVDKRVTPRYMGVFEKVVPYR
ncbi:Uncharacterised protein [Anaerotruncus sp. 2789STDY5834896]|uniref:Calcineurin-like phosphoesterase domain-containing protein n=1 Tax=uncultured Anaerotruncus sp. TaxID=905011 RepID=A0A1C6IBD9_9FIRM|nr:Uncharacterised protein [uncultured Anaerotruncus sp.]